MTSRPPDPPAGVGDFHSQAGPETDGRLRSLRETLGVELPPDLFDRLTRYAPEDETPAEATDEYRERAFEYADECIAYREKISPDSLREWDALPEKIHRLTAGGWVQYFGEYDVEHDSPRSDANTVEPGKYLFFSPDAARVLEDIVVEQFERRPYRAAKVPTKPGRDEDWVLCLYQGDNRYWYDLRGEYHDPPTIRFRGFKTAARVPRRE